MWVSVCDLFCRCFCGGVIAYFFLCQLVLTADFQFAVWLIGFL